MGTVCGSSLVETRCNASLHTPTVEMKAESRYVHSQLKTKTTATLYTVHVHVHVMLQILCCLIHLHNVIYTEKAQ